MEKIIIKNKRKYSQLNIDKDSISSNKSMTSIKNQKQNDKLSHPILESLDKYINSIKSIIKKNISQDSNHHLFKQLNNIFPKISEIIKDLNSQMNQYQKMILYNEAKIRNLQGVLFTELLNKEILQNNITSLLQKEKDYELIKEKTGIIVNNGKIINTNRKDNEIIILRTENSTLKGVIEQYEIKLTKKDEEYNKKMINYMKEKNELIIKLNNLKNEIKNRQNSNYSRYNIAKKKLHFKNKKSYEFSGTNVNESNDILVINNNINHNPSTINCLHTNDNNYYIENLNKLNLVDLKMNTIAATSIHTINHSHKSSTSNIKIKDKFKNYEKESNNMINIKEKESNNTIINKTFNQNQKSKNKSNKKRKVIKTLNDNIYNKIIVRDNMKKDIKNKIIKTDRTKTKSHEHHLSNIDNIYMNNKDYNNFNTYFSKNKQIRKIYHKKTNSNKINNIPFNNDKKDFNNCNNSSKENNKNGNNLVSIKNLILNKGKKNKNNKINLIYRNLLPNSISNTSSSNNSRNLNIRNNMSKLYTFNTAKVPTPKSFANN